MFIVPCKFDRNYPVIFQCIESIKTHMPNEKIAVVDSNSADTSYLSELDKDIIIYDIKNNNYTLEAFYQAYLDNQDEEYFFNIHDSIIIQSDLSFVKQKDLTVLRYWHSPPVPMGRNKDDSDLVDWANPIMNQHLGYGVPAMYKGVFGPIFMCKKKVMDDLTNCGFFNIKATDKFEACAMERITGIVLENLGYDVTNALQGSGGEIYGNYDETYMKKIHLLRM